ncbi:glutathione S-transferase [Fennellomyces sp. T-0311]|nr:glutathione S-transferase [Fennellomyces sp. T-0311]
MSTAAGKVIFYTAAICPYAQRAAIALKEVGLAHEKVEIDLANKPSWYKDVNPETKVPALTIEGKNIAESLVLIELINDLKPEKGLLPSDPIQRAQIRFVIEYFASKINPAGFKALGNLNEESIKEYKETVTAGYTRINELLLEQAPSGPYFLGSQYSLADIAIAPFVARQRAVSQGIFGDAQLDIVEKSPRLKEFLEGIVDRPSFKETYPGDDVIVDVFTKRFGVKPVSA